MSFASSSMMAGSPTALDRSLRSTIGAFAIGTFVSLILYGFSVHQFYRYMRQFPNDYWVIKVLVIAVMVLETLHTVTPMHACYHYLVSNYFNPAAIGQGVWSINITPVFAALIVLFAECFFARRVVLIGLRPKIIGIVAFLCLVSGSCLSIALTVKAFEIMRIDVFGEDTKVLTPLSLGLDAVADGLLAGTIIVTLRQNRASHANSSVFDVAELYFLNTGLLVGILQAIAAILAIRYPLELYWTAVGLNAVKMYGVTLLSVLNSRKLLLSRGVKIFNDETFGRNIISRVNHLAAIERWNVPHNSHDDDAPPVINVKVAAEIEVHGESEGSFTDDRKGMRSAEP